MAAEPGLFPHTPPRWRGFLRLGPKDPWRLVPGTEADTDSEAWAKLLALGLRGDQLVSHMDDPNKIKRPR